MGIIDRQLFFGFDVSSHPLDLQSLHYLDWSGSVALSKARKRRRMMPASRKKETAS
jgi:hypothetical protein